MTSRILTAVMACAARSICAVTRSAGCAGDGAVSESRSQAARLPAAMRTNAICLVDHMETQPFGDERRLVFVFDLDLDVEPHDDVPGLALADFAELGDGTNALADLDRRREPHLVEPVV